MWGERKIKAFVGGFLGFEVKEGSKSPIIKIIFSARFFDPWMDRGLKENLAIKF